ncbi:MAG: PKD domain-containing protein, partial [Chitinophagales bacterium]
PNPRHNYEKEGIFDFIFIACNAFGCDTLTKTAFIEVNKELAECQNLRVPLNGKKEINDCFGTVYDNGGASSNYSNNANGTLVIAPPNAKRLGFTIERFTTEIKDDLLLIYDGTSVNAPLLLSESGKNAPQDTIWAESGALTLYFRSNDSTVSGGFEIDYFSVPTPISPTADFSWTTSNAPLGVPISFQNQSSESNQWFWDFGDGNTSTLEKPVHVFKENGEYEVSLITQNCYAADSTDQIISIQSNPTLEVNPESIEVTLVAGENETQTVNLSNIGVGELYFGIQTNAFEADTLIEKYYTDLGSEIYFFEDVRPFDKFRLEVTINGDFNDTAEFMWLQVEDEEYLSVGINSESAPNGTDILVSFPFDIDLEKAEKWLDDEQLKVKIGRGSNVGLNQGGKNYYQIRLVADHANWLQIPTKNGVIEANEQSSIQAKFDASDLWAGTYFNELRIVNNEAENSVKTIPCTLNVLPHPLADFKKVTGTSCDGKIEFKDKSINEPDSWLWDFGDGNTSTEQNPTHQYTESAYYNVSLKACKGTACNEISKPILLAPIADFNVSSNIFPQNIPISFANLSQGGTGYAWDFGDGNTSTERNPQHSYEGAGTYEIQLITSNCFSSDTSTKIIQIEASPQALISTELLELTLQAGTQTLQNIPIQNIGAGTLEYEAMLQTVFEESTATFDEAGDQTTHTFEGVVASDGLQLKITLNGDFDEAEERVWVRLDGEGMGYVLDKNVDSAEDQTYVMNLSPSIYQHLLADGTLKVELQNSNEVEVRSDRANTHSVELTAFGVPWLSLLDENETIEANQTEELRLEFDASEMNAGIYEFPLQIKTNESADFNYVIPTRLKVIGVGFMVFSANTIDFGEVRIGESGSQTLTFFNGGTDTLFVNEIKLDNPVFSIDVNELTLLPKMSHDATLAFSPTSMGDYEADLTVKSLFEDHKLNLLGNAVGAPKISVTPDSLWVALPIGEQTTKPLTVSNIGTYNLIFEAENATFTRFDSLATEDILQIADTTIHIFENLQMTDSLQLVFEMYGDYNESDEFVEVYLNGQWTATFGVENPDTSFLVRDSLAFSWMDLAEILEEGKLEVMLVNSEEVNTGFTLSERHDVRLKTFDNIWLNVAQEPALVPNNEAKIIDVLFDAQNLELGTYYQDIQIFADDSENAEVIVPTTLVVFENVAAAFEVGFEGVCDGRVQFQDLSSENTVEWHWDFGDETTSMEQNPAHDYELPGVYEVQLVAAHEFGSDTSYLEVTVDFTIADFEVPNLVFLDETIELFNNSLGAISAFWDFGDGNVSTMYQPAYEYDSIGTFTLQLVTESANGCVDTLQKEVLVLFEVGIEDWTVLPDWLQIYPNPVAQLLKVVVNKTNLQGVEIQLFSSLGQLVRQLRFEGKEQEIDVQDLPSGVYYLDLQTADFRGVHKIVVE